MLNFAPTLGINSHRLGRQESLATTSRLSLNRASKFPAFGLMRSTALTLNQPLVQTSKLLSTRIDRSHIGWDNWNPLAYTYDSSLDIESFNEGIDRSTLDVDRSSGEGSFAGDLSLNISNDLADRELNFFTKILTDDLATTTKLDESISIDSVESQQPIAPNSVRSKSKSSAKPKPEKLPVKAKSKTSKPSTLAKASKILSETIDPIQSATVPNLESAKVVRSVESNDFIEPTTSESYSDIVTIFTDSFIDNIEPPSILESFGDRELISPLSDNLVVADSIDLAPLNILPPDNFSPIPTPPQPERVETSTNNIEPNLEVIASTEPVSQLPDFDNPVASSVAPQLSTHPEPTAFPTTEPEIATITFSEPPLQLIPNSDSATLSPSPAVNIGATIVNEPDIDKTTATDPPTVSPSPAVNIGATIVNELDIDKTTATATAPPTVSPSPAIDTADRDRGINKINTPASSQEFSDPQIATLSLDSNVDTGATSINEQLAIDNITIPAAPNIFVTTLTPLPEVVKIALLPNEPEIVATKTPEPSSPNIPEIPTPTSPTHPAVNDEPIIDNSIPAPPGAVLPAIFPTTFIQLPSADPTSISTNELESETITTPEFTTLFISDDFSISPSLEVDAELTPAENNEPAIENETIQASPSIIPPDISVIPTPTATSDSQQLNSLSLLPTEIPPSPDTLDIIRVETEVSIDKISTNSNLQENRIYPIEIDNRIANYPESEINLNSDVLPVNNPNLEIEINLNPDILLANFQNNRNNRADPIDRQLDLNESILPSDNLAESFLNIVPQIESEAPTPVRGYATGGHVKAADRAKEESIASSDTVAAMLTPGEFVINAKDAQKNLNLLTHLNSGGEAETITESRSPELPTASSQAALKTPTSLIQNKHLESLISPSLQPDFDRHQISYLDRSPLASFETSQADIDRSTPNYISPSLIFRKPQSTSRADFSGFDPPDEWNSIEELMNGGSYGSEPFSSSANGLQNIDFDRSISSSSTTNLSPKYSSPVMGFANGGEVPLPDINPKIEPISQTVEAKIPDERGARNSNSAELETLAREIYYRLRQRLEIERERQGIYSGNLAW